MAASQVLIEFIVYCKKLLVISSDTFFTILVYAPIDKLIFAIQINKKESLTMITNDNAQIVRFWC